MVPGHFDEENTAKVEGDLLGMKNYPILGG